MNRQRTLVPELRELVDQEIVGPKHNERPEQNGKAWMVVGERGEMAVELSGGLEPGAFDCTRMPARLCRVPSLKYQ